MYVKNKKEFLLLIYLPNIRYIFISDCLKELIINI